jgi:transposase
MRSPVDRSSTKKIENTGDLVASVMVAGRADLTDAQWTVLEPLLPVEKKPGRPPKWTRRQLIDGIRWRVRAGLRGEMCRRPMGHGRRSTGCFAAGNGPGAGVAILAQLQARADAAGLITWEVGVDSTIARAHQHAAGARKKGDAQKEPPGGAGEPEPADHALGRSRGGLTTKLHLATEQGQKPLSLVITAGQPGDSPQFQVVLGRIRIARIASGRPRTRPDRLLADKAYGSPANRT